MRKIYFTFFIILISTLTFAQLRSSVLASGTYNNHNYEIRVSTSKISWTQAKNECQQLGGYLVTITSANENNFVLSLAVQAATSDTWGPWIGFTDENTEGVWEWVTGEAVVYTNWWAQEPDNEWGGQDYGWMLNRHGSDNGKWSDAGDPNTTAGGPTYSMICEYSADCFNVDTDCDGCIDDFELLNAIDRWADCGR